MSSTPDPSGGPDFSHPLGYRKAEAVWKRLVSREHQKFCACGSYLNHFKWPGSGGDADGHGEEGDGAGDGGTPDISPVGATGGGDGDVSDTELLR
nr:ORF2 [Torque teno Leptonychotes weddellii virus 2]WCS65988.1 ORF2 [Torque teno Leptonychotes weddellii virus 2]WCS66092.1 ORF2 [Torque teno Leptonychotes weddellii virus 2]